MEGWKCITNDPFVSSIVAKGTDFVLRVHPFCFRLPGKYDSPQGTQVLPQWDLGNVPEALSKPPYEPLREASLKHLTLKTVFLLAMASGGRRSKLQALVFDPLYIQFKPKGAGVTLYFTPEFMRKNQEAKPSQ